MSSVEDQIVSISPADLLIDLENPRIAEQSGQREALRAMAQKQERQLLVLAEDIVTNARLHPAELPIVIPSSNSGRFIILDGNRRLTALRALENPEVFVGALPQRVLDQIRSLAAKYQKSPISTIRCALLPDREQTQHWIDLRHTGPNEGAGTVQWGSDEKARFRAHTRGELKLHTRVLNFLQDSGHLSQQDRERVPTTTLERLLKTPIVRQKIGIDVGEGGEIHFLADEGSVVKALLHVVWDLANRTTKVQDVYTKEQRAEYAANFPSDLVATQSRDASVGKRSAVPAEVGTMASAKRTPLVRPATPRDKLIPSDCFLRVKDARVRAIELELRSLSLEDHPNAVVVLFRVFVELSVDFYRTTVLKHGPDSVRAKLSEKLLDAVGDMESKNILNKWEANPVRAACQKSSFLTPSVVMMHEYIHNRHMTPSPTDLRAGWDSLQPFIVAIWPR